jgi:hypothetical protein
VLEPTVDVKRIREQLKAKRSLLFNQFEKNPMDTLMALEIKFIDDQVAELAEQLQQVG